MFSQDHTFAGNPLDRAEYIRRDEGAIQELIESKEGKYLVFDHLNVHVDEEGQLKWLNTADLPSLPNQPTLLGIDDNKPHFALDLSDNSWVKDRRFADCRTTAMQISGPETGILAQARSQLDWHRKNRFCSVCGSKNRKERGGQVLRCETCKNHIFPRTDPVVIMLIIDASNEERCLLGQGKGRMVKSNFYSALAGFIDQGESIEEAVRREVQEESQVKVGQVQYHSSQPWPFPSSLMIGCHGLAVSKEIVVNSTEMANVSWFSREEVIESLNNRHPELRVPGRMAIAHHLIKAWTEGDVRF